MNSAVDHAWHVWINSESGFPRKEEKPKEMPIEPHKRGLYRFKAAMQMLPWLGRQITAERLKSLPMVHQQCSHSAPEKLEENHLQCGLGKRLDSCPILLRLRASFAETMERSYYREKIKDEDIDEASAMTCIWHMLMGSDGFIDWQEGAVQDTSDRKFWKNVYDSLAGEQ